MNEKIPNSYSFEQDLSNDDTMEIDIYDWGKMAASAYDSKELFRYQLFNEARIYLNKVREEVDNGEPITDKEVINTIPDIIRRNYTDEDEQNQMMEYYYEWLKRFEKKKR